MSRITRKRCKESTPPFCFQAEKCKDKKAEDAFVGPLDVRAPLRMLASFRAREARVMPATARSPQPGCGIQREQLFHSLSYDLTFDDTITNSQGVRYARLHGCTRQHQHILILLSRPDTLHTLPLTTLLCLCRVVRWRIATTNLLEQIFHHRAHRAHRGAARGEREGSSFRRSPREPSIA